MSRRSASTPSPRRSTTSSGSMSTASARKARPTAAPSRTASSPWRCCRLGEVRQQRQGEEAVRDGAAVGRAFRALAVDMDPLEVVDRLGEGVDALLRDIEPRRDADLLADALLELPYRRQLPTPRAMAPAMRARTCGSRILESSAGLTITPASTSTEG